MSVRCVVALKHINNSAPEVSRLRTLALCTWADSTYPIHSQVAHCGNSSDILLSGVIGADGQTEFNFNAYPYDVWGREGDPSNTAKHYIGIFGASWSYGPDWSGAPHSVRCVVALKQSRFQLKL